MKRIYTIASLLSSLFLIAPLFVVHSGVRAADIRMDEDNDNVVIDERINDDLYVSGGTVEINDDVNGDLIAFGGQVTVNDDIYGNAIIFGGIININGDIRGSLYCGAGQVTVNGNIDEDLNVGGGIVTVAGDVEDDVRIGAGTVSVRSEEIGGDLLIGAGQGSVSEDTDVDGNEYVDIGGEETSARLPTTLFSIGRRSITSLILTFFRNIAVLLGWLIVGWLLFKFIPVKSRNITDLLSEGSSSIKSLALGFGLLLVLFVAIPVLILLTIIGIGQPFLVVSLSLLSLAFSIAGIYSATGITRMIMKARKPEYKKYVIPMLIGVSAYQILGWIPCCIGLMIKVVITIWGMGGMLLLKWNMIMKAKKKR